MKLGRRALRELIQISGGEGGIPTHAKLRRSSLFYVKKMLHLKGISGFGKIVKLDAAKNDVKSEGLSIKRVMGKLRIWPQMLRFRITGDLTV
jgi:hypothetical protein